MYVIVKSHHKYNILDITQGRGKAKVECYVCTYVCMFVIFLLLLLW